MELAEQAARRPEAAAGRAAVARRQPRLDEARRSAFPNGCHVAEVEIDPDTGAIEVVRYAMVNDFGTVINPMLVEGQAHGGVVQGIGQALMEHVRLRRGGPAAHRLASWTTPCRAPPTRRSSRSRTIRCRQDQPARRQGLRRGGLRRRAAVGDERRRRCAVRGRHHPHRHAGDAGEGLAGAERLVAREPFVIGLFRTASVPLAQTHERAGRSRSGRS